ncbi:uncharacterized protein LOC120339855 isoform X3 [Styela clava]
MFGMESNSASLLAFAAVVVIGAVVMYLVSLFSMKETRFEDVLEEQRKKKEKEDRERSMHNKQKREQYKKKFNEKKKKTPVGNGKVEKIDSSVSPMHEVQIKETPQVETGSGEPAPLEQKKNKGKSKKQETPAPQPKQDSPKQSNPILKPAPEKPKKETEVKQTAATEVKAEPQKKKEAGRTRTVSFSDEVQDKQKNENEQEKSKKKKKKPVEPEAVESEIVIQLREANLGERDVKNIITMIKQKYGIDVGGGSKIKDLQQQLDKANKQLSQSEGGLQQYVSRCMSAENKIEQLKQDLMVEKTKLSSLEKAKQDSDNKHKQEQAMSHARHSNEMKQVQDKIALAGDYDEMRGVAEKLKAEKNILMTEIQKHASVVSENGRLAGDLKQVKHKLQETQHRCAELESKLKEYSSIQQQQVENEKNYRHQVNDQVIALQQLKQSYTTLDGEYQKVKADLQTTQSNSTKLLEQITSLTEDNDSKADTQRALEQRLADSEQIVAERDSKIKDVTRQNSTLSEQVQNMEQQIAQLNSQIVNISQETKVKAEADKQTVQDKEEVTKVQKELEKSKNEAKKLKDEVDKLTKKNNDLRERNWKAMDLATSLEKTSVEKVAATKAEGDEVRAHLQESVKQSLSDAFPNISIREKDFEVWIKSFVNQASESSQQIVQSNDSQVEFEEAKVQADKLRSQLEKKSGEASKLQSKISDLESSVKSVKDQNKSLERDSKEKQNDLSNAISECEKYKKILNSTEEILCKLQGSVEVEEGVWKKKVDEAHQEASKAHQESEELRKKIEELGIEKSSLSKNLKEAQKSQKLVDEMTSQITELKEQLASKEAVTNNGTSAEDGNDVEVESVLSPLPQVDKHQQCEGTPTKSVSCQSESPVQVELADACTDTEAPVLEQHQDLDGFLVIERVDMNDELNQSTALANGYEDEVAKLKERLEKEKNLTKNLGQAATKLQTVLKQTQEQLNEEREKNSGLQKKVVGENDMKN